MVIVALQYATLVALLLVGLAVIGWPLNRTLEALAGRPLPLTAPLSGLCILQVVGWYWLVLGGKGMVVPAAVVLLAAIFGSLLFYKTAFMVVVAVAVVVAIWELHRGLEAKGIDIPEQPLMVGGAAMVAVAYFWGANALTTATAVSALVIMLWLLRRGVDGFVRNATAAVFTLALALSLACAKRKRCEEIESSWDDCAKESHCSPAHLMLADGARGPSWECVPKER